MVIKHDVPHRKLRALGQHAVHAFGNVLLMIVRHGQHGQFHGRNRLAYGRASGPVGLWRNRRRDGFRNVKRRGQRPLIRREQQGIIRIALAQRLAHGRGKRGGECRDPLSGQRLAVQEFGRGFSPGSQPVHTIRAIQIAGREMQEVFQRAQIGRAFPDQFLTKRQRADRIRFPFPLRRLQAIHEQTRIKFRPGVLAHFQRPAEASPLAGVQKQRMTRQVFRQAGRRTTKGGKETLRQILARRGRGTLRKIGQQGDVRLAPFAARILKQERHRAATIGKLLPNLLADQAVHLPVALFQHADRPPDDKHGAHLVPAPIKMLLQPARQSLMRRPMENA